MNAYSMENPVFVANRLCLDHDFEAHGPRLDDGLSDDEDRDGTAQSLGSSCQDPTITIRPHGS